MTGALTHSLTALCLVSGRQEHFTFRLLFPYVLFQSLALTAHHVDSGAFLFLHVDITSNYTQQLSRK